MKFTGTLIFSDDTSFIAIDSFYDVGCMFYMLSRKRTQLQKKQYLKTGTLFFVH